MTERELQKRLNHVREQKAKAVAEVGRLESEVSKAINRLEFPAQTGVNFQIPARSGRQWQRANSLKSAGDETPVEFDPGYLWWTTGDLYAMCEAQPTETNLFLHIE